MTIANRLNELIAEKRIQKKQLAERIGVAASTLNTWLSRGEDFPAQYVIPICGVLGISAEKLLEGRDVPLPVIPDDYVQITAEERFLLDTLRNLDREGVIVVTNKAIEEARASGLHRGMRRLTDASAEALRRWGIFELLEGGPPGE